MFIDKIKVHAKAGDGGKGSASFRREKYIEYGGPDGGDGGAGGDVVLMASKDSSDLTDFYFTSRLIAKHGGHGSGRECSGRDAPDLALKVPVGTQVYRLDDDVRELIADLVEDGQRFVLAKGGKGGRGNVHFKSSTHRAPREFEYGTPGEDLRAELELKTLADVGLVGYPNAGKSTLISKITQAHPNIASYPFTTLTPNVGIVTCADFTRIRVADIPGLIDGAHTGKGLGHDFLRHIERCKLLLFLLDMAGVDGRKPADDYRKLLAEVKAYNPAILKKPRLVVANKMDLPTAKKNLTAFKKKHRVRVLEISAQEGAGLEKLKLALRRAVS